MDLELGQLDRRYEKLRRKNVAKERRLVASLAEKGQLLPAVVVAAEAGKYVLLDGYKRARGLESLRQDIIHTTVWDIAESEALVLERLMRCSEADGPLEQGWFLEELAERFRLSHEELARRFDKSQSWVSRRLALVRAVPAEVQACVQSGVLPAHAAMKFLVPMARAKRADCLRLVAAIGDLRPSTREVGALYAAWLSGGKKTRELVLTNPTVVLRAREAARQQSRSEKTPARKLCDDFGILTGISRRARKSLEQGVLAPLVASETQEVQRLFLQARAECDALFRKAMPLLTTEEISTPPAQPQELSDAR